MESSHSANMQPSETVPGTYLHHVTTCDTDLLVQCILHTVLRSIISLFFHCNAILCKDIIFAFYINVCWLVTYPLLFDCTMDLMSFSRGFRKSLDFNIPLINSSCFSEGMNVTFSSPLMRIFLHGLHSQFYDLGL